LRKNRLSGKKSTFVHGRCLKCGNSKLNHKGRIYSLFFYFQLFLPDNNDFIFKISSYPTKLLKMCTPINPVIETIVSIIVQVRKVCRMLKLKYSLNNQKPPSFTCENIRLPAPIESTINSGRMC